MGQTLYIDWEGHEILTEEGYSEKINAIVEENYEDDDLLEDFLNDNYGKLELFNMSLHDKDEVLDRFKQNIIKSIEYDPCEYGLYYEAEYIE